MRKYKKPIRFPKAMYRKKFYRDLKFLDLKKHCYITIKQTLNNMFITIKHTKGKLILSKSIGTSGFKGPKKSTSHAAVQLAKDVKNSIRNQKKTATLILLSRITGKVKAAIKNISNKYSLRILDIIERIPVPHNGLRKPSLRRK